MTALTNPTGRARVALLAVVALVALAPASDAAGPSAGEILERVDAAAATETSRIELTQTVVGPSGDTRTFEMVAYSADNNEKGLTEYLSPNQVRGMKILTLDDGDDIWVYFPRTNRTRKIASSARNRRVQGSDFNYDDMATGKFARDWRGTVAGSAQIDGDACHVLDLEPTDEGPKSYTKARAWVRRADDAVVRVEYWDRYGDKTKRLDIGDYRTISGVLVPHEYTMTNLTDGGKTTMRATDVRVDAELPASLFNQSTLGN